MLSWEKDFRFLLRKFQCIGKSNASQEWFVTTALKRINKRSVIDKIFRYQTVLELANFFLPFLLISFLSIRIFTWISSFTDYPGISRKRWRYGKTENQPKPLRKCLARVHWRPGCHLWQHSFVDCRRPRWEPFYLELLGAQLRMYVGYTEVSWLEGNAPGGL